MRHIIVILPHCDTFNNNIFLFVSLQLYCVSVYTLIQASIFSLKNLDMHQYFLISLTRKVRKQLGLTTEIGIWLLHIPIHDVKTFLKQIDVEEQVKADWAWLVAWALFHIFFYYESLHYLQFKGWWMKLYDILLYFILIEHRWFYNERQLFSYNESLFFVYVFKYFLYI